MGKKIVLTGGGTAGHVTPNMALIPRLRELGYEISYMGSYDGIEKKLMEDFNLPYYGIATGKFRRYFDPKNFSDPFRVIKGMREARKYLKEINPDVVFSKGGFVSVPVVRAAGSLGIPCIIHESDMTPGLANKLCISVAKKVCCNFPETLQQLPPSKAVLTGSPIRQELSSGSREAAYKLCGFDSSKPVIMVVGGSQGSAAINQAVEPVPVNALGVMEFFSVTASVWAADAAVKAAEVDLMDVRLGTGIGGKSFVVLSGDVAAVHEAVEAGVRTAAENGLLVSQVVIPNPKPEVFNSLL